MKWLVLLVVACKLPSRSEHIRTTSTAYHDAAMWLCRPDKRIDACRGDLTTTEITPDGGHVVHEHHAAVDAPVDCFYIYPTVDLGIVAGNHVDFHDTGAMQLTAAAQIARFSEVCNVYAPLYRQATIATYIASANEQKRFFDVAYSDVAAAFHEYLTYFDRGKPIVIVGHSQGAQMAARLLHDTFDQSDRLRPRLLVAMPIGFAVDVPGTFQNLAACTRPEQTGCVIAYRSIAAGDTPSGWFDDQPPGHHAMCVEPSGRGVLSESVFLTGNRDLGINTPFVAVRDYYRAQCKSVPRGRDYLEIGEARHDHRLVDLGGMHGGLGLHIYDMAFAQGDLIEAIRVKLARFSTSTTSTPSRGTTVIVRGRDAVARSRTSR